MIVLPSISSGIISSSLSKTFDPKKISGLSLWLKADAGVTLSGSDVTAWADQSGNGNNATAPTTNPTFIASSINSKPAISFNGDGSWLQVPQNNIGNEGNISIFVVLNYVSGLTIFNKGDLATYEETVWEITTSNGFGFVDDIDAEPFWNVVPISIATNTPLLLEAFSSGGASQIAFDGTNSGSPSGPNSEFNNISQYLGIGAGGDGGGTAGNPLNARIAEIIIYNRQVTTPERQQVETYLANKYAIQIPTAENMFLPQLWLKADAGVTLSGANVTAWADQSGNGNNCSSPNAVVLNSSPYPYIYFGGGDTESEITLHPDVFNGFSALSLFAVWNIVDNGNGGVIGSTTYSNFEIITQDGSVVRMRNDNYDESINTGGLWYAEEFVLSTITADSAGGGSGTARRNGAGVDFDDASIEALQGGQTYKIGVYGGSYFTELSLAELIVYSNKLTDAQIIQVESYLNSKYAIY